MKPAPGLRAGAGSALLSRREVLRRVGLAGAAATLPWGTVFAGGSGVRIGVAADSLAALPVLRAARQGYFRGAGVPVEVRTYHDAQSIGVFLAGGELDMGVLPTPMFFAVTLGSGIFAGRGRELVTGQVALTDGSVLLAGARSEIRYSRQFRGHAIGLEHRLGMPHLLTDVYLVQSGLVVGEDTRLVEGERAALATALGAGELGGAALDGMPAARLVAAGLARPMVPLYKLWDEHPAEVLAAPRSFLEQRADAFRRVSAATLRAARELSGGDGLSPELERAVAIGRAGFQPFPYRSALELLLVEMQKRGLVPAAIDPQRTAQRVTLSGFCRSQMAEVGFASIPDEDVRDERLVGCCVTYF